MTFINYFIIVLVIVVLVQELINYSLLKDINEKIKKKKIKAKEGTALTGKGKKVLYKVDNKNYYTYKVSEK